MARFRGVAQPGSALRSGRRGPQFESGHPDLPSLPRSILVLFGCGAVLLSTGCGGGGGGGSSSTGSQSEAAFRSRANHICKKLSDQGHASAGSTNADIQQRLSQIDAAVAGLEGLNPPAQDKQRYQALLTNFKATVTFIKTNRERLIRLTNQLNADPSNKKAFRRIQQLIGPYSHKIELARSEAAALGLGACASGFSSSSNGSGSGVGSP
jgi:hypothetical protein